MICIFQKFLGRLYSCFSTSVCTWNIASPKLLVLCFLDLGSLLSSSSSSSSEDDCEPDDEVDDEPDERMFMSNLTFSSCSSYAPSMTSSSSLVLIFLYPSHLKNCPRDLKNFHRAFSFSSHFDLWSHFGLQLSHLTILAKL